MMMEQVKVVGGISPSVSGRDAVIHFHCISILKEPSAFPALPLLFPEELSDSRRNFRVAAEPGAPVDPFPVERATTAFHFHVPADWSLTVVQ
jgi:hypothetical protein